MELCQAMFTVLGPGPLETPRAMGNASDPVMPSPLAESGPSSTQSVTSNRKMNTTPCPEAKFCHATIGRSLASRRTCGTV